MTVICILSFIWAGFAIIGGGLGYFGMKMMASGALEEMLTQTGDVEAITKYEEAQAELAESGLDAAKTANLMLVGIVLAIVALVGVIFMWKLKRSGFYVYTGAQLVGIVSPLLMGGKITTSGMGLFVLVLSVVFIVLYGTNLKHMR